MIPGYYRNGNYLLGRPNEEIITDKFHKHMEQMTSYEHTKPCAKEDYLGSLLVEDLLSNMRNKYTRPTINIEIVVGENASKEDIGSVVEQVKKAILSLDDE